MSRIIAIHLLNDYSGSPFVLRQALEALRGEHHDIQLYTATPGEGGFLSGIPGIRIRPIFYRWSRNRWLTLAFYLFSQASLFGKLLLRLRRDDVVYINSLLPFGAAMAAWCRGCKVVYHCHEVSIRPAALMSFLLRIANGTATVGLFVSEDLRRRIPFRKPAQIVYNSLPEAFVSQAAQPTQRRPGPKQILMLASLKRYKGVDTFVACAQNLPQYRFTLVLNADEDAICEYFGTGARPHNLRLISAQKNVHPFYREADIVLNLSRTDQWLETFGMTILEAMYYGRPTIIPDAGGITELVSDGLEGFRTDTTDVDAVCGCICSIAENDGLYERMSAAARSKAQRFQPASFRHDVCEAFAALTPATATSAVLASR